MHTLLIADKNEDFRMALELALQDHFLIRSCDSGLDALEMIRQSCPDILVLELMLPEMDGLNLLQILREEQLHPMILIVSSAISPYVEACFDTLGISYMIQKPCQIRCAVNHILQFQQFLDAPPKPLTPEHILWDLLQPLGIRPYQRSHEYIAESILYQEQHPRQPLSSGAYLHTAEKYDISVSAVECGIRRDLSLCWQQSGPDAWKAYFPEWDSCPTNKAFLLRIAEIFHNALE